MTTYSIGDNKKVSHELFFDGKNWDVEEIECDFCMECIVFAWRELPEPYHEP